MRTWLAALALTATACSPALLSPVDGGGRDVEELRERNRELERRQSESEAEIERLRGEVARLEAELAARTDGGDESPPPAAVLDDRVGGDERPAGAEIESADIPAPRPAPAPVPVTTPGESPATPPGAAGETAAAPQPLTPAAQELYDRGYTFYHQNRYLDAESAFQQFLSAYPDTELADNASYWIGEARFGRGDYRGALAAFGQTLERYPDGNKVADALLKMGDSLARLGDAEGARDSYSEVIRRFPSSAAAITAEERRAELP